MKKSLFIILSCMLAAFIITGCSEDSDNNSGNSSTGTEGGNTTLDYSKELTGTYEITFFGTQVTNAKGNNETIVGMADLMYISNDCAKAKELYPDIIDINMKNQCPTEDNDGNPQKGIAELLDGIAVVSIENNKLKMSSRVQLAGQIMDTFAPADKYQFTEYYETTGLSGKGVKGWNYDADNNKPSAQPLDFPNSPYSLSVLDDGSVRIDLTLVGKSVNAMRMGIITVDAKTTVIMQKKNDSTTPLENAIQKPFSVDVLVAKVNALLRRTYNFVDNNSNQIIHNGVTLDLSTATINYEDNTIELTKNEIKILHELMKYKGQIVSRNKLMKKLWDNDWFVDDNTLTVNVNRIRSKLNEIGLEDFIETKRGLGYIIS